MSAAQATDLTALLQTLSREGRLLEGNLFGKRSEDHLGTDDCFFSYVIALEARMERAEEVIAKLAPFIDINQALGPMPQLPGDKKEGGSGEDDTQGTSTVRTQSEEQDRLYALATSTEYGQAYNASLSAKFDPTDASYEYYDEEDEEDEDAAYLHTQMRNVALEDAGADQEGLVAAIHKSAMKDAQDLFRIAPGGDSYTSPGTSQSTISSETPLQFLGRASTFHLLPLLDKKIAQSGNSTGISVHASCDDSETSSDDLVAEALRGETEDLSKYNIAWPAPELRKRLIDAYFKRSNRDFPVLNEVITRRWLSKPSSQWKDAGTMGIALGIFAIASRHCQDNYQEGAEGNTSGPYWFKALNKLQADTYSRHGTSLMYLQGTVLSIICE